MLLGNLPLHKRQQPERSLLDPNAGGNDRSPRHPARPEHGGRRNPRPGVQQILSGAYLQRTDWISGLEILELLVVGLAIIAAIIFTSRPVFSFAVGVAFAGIVVSGSWLAFVSSGLLIDPSFPLLGGLIIYALILFFRFVITDADKRRMRSVFSNYVSPDLLSQIEHRDSGVKLGGGVKPASSALCFPIFVTSLH